MPAETQMNIEQARFNMIEQQIRPWDVLDPQVLDLLFVVKREDFAPAAYRNLAFADMEIPIGDGQVMLAPKIEAKMMQELGIKKTDKVLEIGTGSGYMAAQSFLGSWQQLGTRQSSRPGRIRRSARPCVARRSHSASLLLAASKREESQ